MLKTRVITALVMLAVFATALFFFPTPAWLAFVSIVVGIAAWEWGGLCRWSPRTRYMYGVLGAAISFGLGLFASSDHAAGAQVFPVAFFVSTAFWLLFGFAWLARGWQLGSGLVAAGVGGLVLLPTALAMMYLRNIDPHPWCLLGAMAIVSIADIAAYFAGRAFGRRKLAPSISPGKSWEGVYGALVAVVIYGLITLVSAGARFSPAAWGGVVLGLLLVTGISVAGDLFESLLKRQASIKDSSQLLPGHGGVLDRIDSLTSTLPVVALFVYLVR